MCLVGGGGLRTSLDRFNGFALGLFRRGLVLFLRLGQVRPSEEATEAAYHYMGNAGCHYECSTQIDAGCKGGKAEKAKQCGN